MADFLDLLKAGLPIAGAATGGVAGGPAGANIGAGVGNALSMGIDLLKQDSGAVGPLPQEYEALFFAGENAREAMSLDGASSRTVGRMTQAGRESGAQGLQSMNTLLQGASPLDMARVTDELMTKASGQRIGTMDAVKDYAEGARSKQMFAKIQATDNYEKIAGQVRNAKIMKRLQDIRFEQSLNKQMEDAMGSMMKGMAGSALDPNGGISDVKKAPPVVPGAAQATPPTPAPAPFEGDGFNDNGVAATDLRQGFEQRYAAAESAGDDNEMLRLLGIYTGGE